MRSTPRASGRRPMASRRSGSTLTSASSSVSTASTSASRSPPSGGDYPSFTTWSAASAPDRVGASGARIARVIERLDHDFLVAGLADVDRAARGPVAFRVVVGGIVMGTRLELAPGPIRVAMLDAQGELSGATEIHDDLLT